MHHSVAAKARREAPAPRDTLARIPRHDRCTARSGGYTGSPSTVYQVGHALRGGWLQRRTGNPHTESKAAGVTG